MIDKKVRIQDRCIGKGEPCFIIAEAGVNHNGNVEIAKKLIDCAVGAGADAVKFQTFTAENLVIPGAVKAEYQQQCGEAESQYDMLKKLELTSGEFRELSVYAGRKGIIFISTPFDSDSADFLDSLGVPAFKIPSGEITNLPLLASVGRKRKPVILSTGMATVGEIDEALTVLRDNGSKDIVILHCTTDYPARYEEANIMAIRTLECAFQIPVGFSDHTHGIHVGVAALALGACVIEKHFTLNRNETGPDHRASIEPDELVNLVRWIRDTEAAFGTGIKAPTPSEKKIMDIARKSIVAACDIPKGTLITGEMLACKRPGTGISPKYLNLVMGRRVKSDISKSEILSWEVLG